MRLSGVITSLVTPFKNQKLEEEELRTNIREQLQHGVQGILLLGTVGEAPTLLQEEQERVIKIGVEEAKGKIPILVGTGSYSTQATIEKTLAAYSLGADAALIVTPYYNKPTQEGLYKHFEAIAQAVDIPIFLYNNPTRTAINIETDTLKKIAALPQIKGIKETSGNIFQTNEILHKVPHLQVLAGDDALTLPIMSLGGQGIISTASNLIPKEMVQLVKAIEGHRYHEAKTLHFQLLPLFQALFLETNPIPLKEAMRLCHKGSGECRLPLCAMQPKYQMILLSVLESMQLISSPYA